MRCLCSLRWYKQASSERRLVCVRSLNVVCFKKAGGECMQSTPKNMWLCESVNPCTVWGLLVCEQVLAWQCRGKMIRNVVSGSAIFFQVHKKKKKDLSFVFVLTFLPLPWKPLQGRWGQRVDGVEQSHNDCKTPISTLFTVLLNI